MLDLIAVDTVSAYTLETGDTIKHDGVVFVITEILDGDDITLSGLDEYGDDVSYRVDAYDKIDILGFPIETDEDF